MANGRPTGDESGRSFPQTRGKGANQEGLAALGRQMRTGSGPGERGQRVRPAGARRPHRRGRRAAQADGAAQRGAEVEPAQEDGGRRSSRAVVLLVAVVGGGYAYLWYRYDQINKVHVSDEVAANGGPFTILVIGSDTRVGESSRRPKRSAPSALVTGQRSDVVQLWRVTPSTKQIQIVSIPRDTVVSMLPPDNAQFGTYNRINSSYNSGANQLVKTITANFGIPINHVVQVDFAGFQDAVNALGGIYLDFPYPAKDAYSRARTSRRPAASCSTAPRRWPWPGPATTSTTPTATGSTTGRATSGASSARTPSSSP